MSEQKNIVILGGAWGGVSTAHYVLRHAIPKLPSKASYKVILVSPSPAWYCRTASPRAMISEDSFTHPLFHDIAQNFTQYPSENFRFIQGKATAWDDKTRVVKVEGESGVEELSYYSLVVATGSSTPSPLMGAHDGQKPLKNAWASFREKLPQAKHIVIMGGGPTGVETAGELGEYLNGKPGWFAGENKNPKVKITLVHSGPHLLPYLRPSIGDKADPILGKLGVTVVKGRKITSVTPENAGKGDAVASNATVTLDDGTKLEADIYIPAAGYTPNTSFAPSSVLASDERIKVDSHLRVTSAGERVYALGDCSDYGRQAIHLLLDAIPVAGNNVKRDLFLAAGKEGEAPAEKTFVENTKETHLVPIGKGTGVGAGMGFAMPGLVISMLKGTHYWSNTMPPLANGKQWAKEA